MPIDWFTVVAQIINFVVLVWILKRFLYRPILKAMNERQERVRQSLSDAAGEKERATRERAQLEEERHDLAQHREEELARIEADATSRREELGEEARREFEQARAHWQKVLANEKALLQQKIGAQAGEEVMAITNRLLQDLANTDLQERVVLKFLNLLKNLESKDRQQFQSSMQANSTPSVTLHSAFELSPQQKTALTRTLAETFTFDGTAEFEVKPALVCGIEVGVDGHKISWTVENYLRSLHDCVGDLIAQQARENERRSNTSAMADQ